MKGNENLIHEKYRFKNNLTHMYEEQKSYDQKILSIFVISWIDLQLYKILFFF